MNNIAITDEAQNIEEISAQLIRDHCHCIDCRDQHNGQRLRSVLDLDPELFISEIEEDDENGLITFILSDGHSVELSVETVSDITQELMPLNLRGEGAKVLWDAENAPTKNFNWLDISVDNALMYEMLDQIVTFGFAIIENLPNHDRAVLDLIKSFGYPRITNYGDIFDVRIENDPNNLAFTNLPIAPHTDNPYRDPVATLQLLHCLETNVEGGNSGLVDGFRSAILLRTSAPESFDLLSTRQFHFEYQNSTTHLTTTAPIIKVDSMKEIVEIRWNDRSMQPPYNDVEVDEVYQALRTFAVIVNDPANMHEFRLEPGHCVIFDNTRLLHSRTGFESSGKRHLQGAYADLDSLMSKWSILEDTLES
jgi:gamma-butyrobetaine dioxygenase